MAYRSSFVMLRVPDFSLLALKVRHIIRCAEFAVGAAADEVEAFAVVCAGVSIAVGPAPRIRGKLFHVWAMPRLRSRGSGRQDFERRWIATVVNFIRFECRL